MPTVAIVSTGYEVLRGYTLNTNASWLARRATECGARLTTVLTVGDAVDDLVRALQVVPGCQFDRIACVAQVHEIGALHDPTGVDVEARDHPDSERHRSPLVRASASSSVNRPS